MSTVAPTVAEFLADYATASPKTLAYYQDHVGRALKVFLDTKEVRDLAAVTPAVLREWLAFEGSRTYQVGGQVRQISPTTLGHRYNAGRRFFEWCVEQEYILTSPMRKVRRPRTAHPEVHGFAPAEIKALVKESKRACGWLGKRDHAIVLFLLDTGARASELLTLTPASFDWPRRRVSLYGKGQKRRWVPLGPKAHAALREYLAARPDASCPGIWINQRRLPFDYGALSMMLRNLGKYANVVEVRAHRFRHTYAASWYTENRDIMALKGLLGHSKVSTTQIYLQSLGIDYGSDREYRTPGEWLA